MNVTMELCRVCTRTYSEMTQIFDTNKQEDIAVRIEFCTGILFTKEDNLPSKICSECLKDLHTAHKFKTNCVNSNLFFQNVTVKTIKCESIETFDDNKFSSNCEENQNINGRFKNENSHGEDSIGDLNLNWESDIELEIKKELVADKRSGKRVRLKKEKNTSNDKTKIQPVKPKRSYNKINGPTRKRKLKYRRLACESCDIKFTSKKESDDHKKEFHEKQVWICEVCGKVFPHRGSYSYHVRTHYPPHLACNDCDYRTTNKPDLAKHVMIHSGLKTYKCPICAHPYRTSSNLHQHVRFAHQRLRPHACPMCAHTFADRTKLNRHIDSHNDVKRFSCEVCHSSFTRRCYWKKHLERQHGIVIAAMRPGRRRNNVVVEAQT